MNKIIARAEKRAISMLVKEARYREACRTYNNPRSKKMLKAWFIKEFWRGVNEQTAKEAGQDSVSLDLHTVAASFASRCSCLSHIEENPAWVGIKLSNRAYWVSRTSDDLYITAGSMETFQIKTSVDKLVSMVEAFDAYLGENEDDIERVFERGMMEYYALRKSEEILKVTAMALIQDLIGEDGVKFEVVQQKNGRLRFTLVSRNFWQPPKTFKTSFETLREDFAREYEAFKSEKW